MFDTVPKLTAAMAGGDRRAVEVFYRRYFDLIYSQARRFTRRDEAFCLDVVQDALLRIIRSVRSARDEAELLAWVRLVVQTAAYDRMRSDARRGRREAAAVAARDRSNAACTEDRADADVREWLRTEIASMDGQIVRMIDLRFQQRWTLARIAESMGLTVGTVDGRLRRAFRELRARAREQGHE